ncbi:hypothetical protein ACLB2K_056463 [Fragaria x ananassa]
MKLRLMIEKLQKGLSLLATKIPHDEHDDEFDEDVEVAKTIPEDAKEEYGFHQKGALEVPCRPEDLHKILGNRREKSMTSATCNNTNSKNTLNLIEGY